MACFLHNLLQNCLSRLEYTVNDDVLIQYTQDVTKRRNGDWGMGNGEWGMGNEK